MARMIGDMGLNYYIKDVVVRPDYQGKRIGKMLIDELMCYVKQHGIKGTGIFVELCAMPDKIYAFQVGVKNKASCDWIERLSEIVKCEKEYLLFGRKKAASQILDS